MALPLGEIPAHFFNDDEQISEALGIRERGRSACPQPLSKANCEPEGDGANVRAAGIN
jgi:hypothetical protein